jgi:hypothetical protein
MRSGLVDPNSIMGIWIPHIELSTIVAAVVQACDTLPTKIGAGKRHDGVRVEA